MKKENAMKKVCVLFVVLLALTSYAAADWVRFECEDMELSGAAHLEIDPCNPGPLTGTGESNDGYIWLENPSGNLGQFLFSVNVRKAQEYSARFSVNAPAVGEHWDSWYLNNENGPGPDGQACRENYAAEYSWSKSRTEGPHDWVFATWQDFVDSITTYGTGDFKWQIVSRWAPSWNDAGKSMNVPMTFELQSGYNQIWVLAGWGWASYDFIDLDLPPAPSDPDPADRSLVNVLSPPANLTWVNATSGLDKVEVYFGAVAEPNLVTESNYKTVLSLIATINSPTDPPATDSTTMPVLADNTTYVWVVDGFKDVDPPGTDPNYGGVFWAFDADDNAYPVADAGEDQNVYLGMDVDPCSVYVELDGSNSSDDGLP
ncbi:MAG: hypothetical protein JW860_01365, partial [Sedimentisphaerales bacterium]|nr:hypothetical protein [Sedimentisphaerales bacterium]